MSRSATNAFWSCDGMQQNTNNRVLSPDPQQLQYANLPAALLSTLKRDKKPFTYTPGGVNLSEVLEARLQKRMERKKKYMEEMEQEQNNRRQLLVSPTYNSPLNMYSMENALETLEMQAKMATNQSPFASSSTLPRNYKFKFQEDEDVEPSQSKAFRVLQVMTDTEPHPGDKRQRGQQTSYETRFTGIREGRPTNPSKFFHTLQKITGTEEEEEDERENVKVERWNNIQQYQQSQAPPTNTPSPQHQQSQVTPTSIPVTQKQPSYGSIPLLKRPAAFLPKQQSWSYQRMPVVMSVGTDF